MIFYPGLHQPSDAIHFRRAFVSINRLWNRDSSFGDDCEIIIDSGAFTELSNHGRYRKPVHVYAKHVVRWKRKLGARLIAAVSQDYMCEPFILAKTGLTIEEHQQLTIERYIALKDLCAIYSPDLYIMPVLQGFSPEDYVRHIKMYEEAGLLPVGSYVGVGSVCKRNSDPGQILAILQAIHGYRWDLDLHGFGLKLTALENKEIRDLLHSADSMAWSFTARKQGRNANDWLEADEFRLRIEALAAKVLEGRK